MQSPDPKMLPIPIMLILKEKEKAKAKKTSHPHPPPYKPPMDFDEDNPELLRECLELCGISGVHN